MSLDLTKLQNLQKGDGKMTARCPACAETGTDSKGEHLVVYDTGKYACIQHLGDTGKDHRQRIHELMGLQDYANAPSVSLPGTPIALPSKKPALHIPSLRKLNPDEILAISQQRQCPALFLGLVLLSNRGLLWQGMIWDEDRDWPAWVITDSAGRNVQGRRLDGQLWHGIGDSKAKTLPGSEASWPIGAPEIGARPLVLLCEGQSDFCAALLVADEERQGMAGFSLDQVAPVCLTGAGNNIHADALHYFEGKHIRISIHADEPGWAAAQRWADQLYRAGAKCVQGIAFDGLTRPDGQPVKDLADYAMLLHPDKPRPPLLLVNLPDSLTSSTKSNKKLNEAPAPAIICTN